VIAASLVMATLSPLLGAPPPTAPGPDEAPPTAPIDATGSPGLDAVDHLDAASACLRRALLPCAISESEAAAAAAPPASDLRREALRIAATAKALAGDDEGASAAFRALRDEGSSYRPDPDADPRVLDAFRASRRPAEATPAPDPTPRPEDPPIEPPFFVSVGAGVGWPAGSDRYGAGLAAALELGWRLDARDPVELHSPRLALTAQLHLAWLPLDDALPVEPGQETTLGTLAFVLGLDLRVGLAPAWDLVLQAGVGAGRFAIGEATSGPAVALHAGAGVRWRLGDGFAIRAELAPILYVPVETSAPGGHPAALLRAEGSF
jgi:hypothetical protein